jgi:cytochrome c oxidase assembly protein subunit 15
MTVSAPPASPLAAKTSWWRRTPPAALVRVFAWSAVISNGLIAVTGATVRVTGSGLGCETWPDCQPGSLVPVSRSGMAAVHQAIEFSNRTLTVVVLIASLGTFVLIAGIRPVRGQLIWLAAVGPVGVLAQAIWGGIVVYTGLRWWTVAPHLLVSLVLVFVAIVVLIRLGESDGPVTATVPTPLRVLTWVTVGVLGAVCVVGTLVTAAGPHAGDASTPRLDVPVRGLAQLHADLMFAYLGLMVALTIGFLAVRAPRSLLVRAWWLVGITVGQGAIGLIQYATGVPEVLVLFHVLGAVCLVSASALVAMGTRERPPAPVAETPSAGTDMPNVTAA